MEQVLNYAKSLNAHEDIFWWLENIGKKSLKNEKCTISHLEHIIDWFCSINAPKRLQKMSLKTAIDESKKWSDANIKKGKNIKDTDDDIEDFMSFDDKSKIVLLKTTNSFKREGTLMGHCLGGYSIRKGFEIYSLRDEKNNPHATFEVNKSDNQILQVKGKGNGEIHPKYIHRVLAFLEKIGIKVRKEEMKNIGYYYAHPKHMEIIKKCLGKNEKLVEINGDFYVI